MNIRLEQCKDVNDFFEQSFIHMMKMSPEWISFLRIFPKEEMRKYNCELDDASDEFARKRYKDILAIKDEFEKIDYAGLSERDKLSADIFRKMLEYEIEDEQFMYQTYPVNQFFGIHTGFPDLMITIHTVEDCTDAEHYIERLRKSVVKFEQTIDGVNERAERGTIPPLFVIEKIINDIDAFISQEPKDNPLVASFRGKVEKACKEKADELVKKAEEAVIQEVYPSYRKLRETMENLKHRADDKAGVWKLENGEKYYEYSIRRMTTFNISPEEVYQTGVKEVERIEKEIIDNLAKTEFKGMTIRQAYNAMLNDKRFLYSNDDEGRKQCIADFNDILNEIDTGVDEVFDIRPKAGCEVKRIPEFSEQNFAGGYYQSPSMDGTRPGAFYVNLRDTAEVPKFTMRTLTYHEAVPGHHFQIAIEQELGDIPLFRKNIWLPAYVEGWALYAEKLAYEMGFQKDVFSNLGRLDDELMRAVRCVVDTGIHYKKWTRQKAIEYMYEHSGKPLPSIETEIDRYIIWPGQAVSYKIGEIKILKLRDKAKKEMGSKFDIRKFHRIVLANGSLPLEILEQKIDQYIETA